MRIVATRLLLVCASATLALLAGGCGVSIKNADRGASSSSTAAMLLTSNHLARRPTGVVEIDGRTQGSLTSVAAEAFQGAGARIAITDNGEARAFSELCRGQIDIADSARPISPAELSVCRGNGVQPVQFVVAADAVVLATRNETDVGADCLTLAQIRSVFEAGSQITNWAQLGYYDVPLRVAGPGESENAFGFFGRYVLGAAEPTLADLRGDYEPLSGDDAVRRAIVDGPLGTIGYVRFTYYESHESELRPLELDNGARRPQLNCVFPSQQTVSDGSFPLARQLLLTVALADLRRPEVAGFVRFYLAHARSLATAAQMVALPRATIAAEMSWLSGTSQPPVIGPAPLAPTPTGAVPPAADGEQTQQSALTPAGGVGDQVSTHDVPLSASGTSGGAVATPQSSQPLLGGQ